MIDSKDYEHFALEYDKWFDNHEKEYALELDAIRALLPETGTGIEIGAGTGRFTKPLGVSLGLEPSGAMRSIALHRGVNAIDGTAESLPIEDNIYDYALLVTTVCFLAAPEVAFREVHRILNPEGVAVVGMIDKNSVLGRSYEKKKNSSRFYKNAVFHTVEDMRKMLEKAGFGSIEIVQAILPADVEGSDKPRVKPGYGEGSFVVLRAQKRGA